MSDPSHRDPSGPPSIAARTADKNRRRFLMFGAGTAGAVAAAPVLAGPGALVAESVDQTKSKGYQETSHVRNYYATTRI